MGGRFDWIEKELSDLKEENLYRELKVLSQLRGTRAVLNGKEVCLFCGNDYLGLSRHPEVIRAAGEAMQTEGVSVASARLISGTTEWHERLEERIARFFGRERALVFSSGYLANLGALSALAHSDDVIILDKLCHASLIDAAKLAGTAVRVYPHRKTPYLEKILKNLKGKRAWVVTDSVFSMDGDLAPLPDLVQLKNRYGAYLVLDEAHGTGVYGANGRGVAEHFHLLDEVDLHIGTLSKSVGAVGGFVTGTRELISYLVNKARPFIFETALPPLLCAASLEAFELIERKPELRKRLWDNARVLKKGLNALGALTSEGDSPIIPVILGDEKKTLDAAATLLKMGFLIPAVRYPTVPRGAARLRITVSAVHSSSELDALLHAFKFVFEKVNEPVMK